MIDLFEAALEIQTFLLNRNWRFCIIGGMAVGRWGRPHATQDVDINLLTGFGSERMYIDQILSEFKARISNADSFALENRVLLISASNGIPLDISLAGIPFEEQLTDRASSFEFAPGVSLITCSAEDLVVLKAFAGRAHDWSAVEGILVAQGDNMDWNYINEHLSTLCEVKGDRETIVRLEQLRKSCP